MPRALRRLTLPNNFTTAEKHNIIRILIVQEMKYVRDVLLGRVYSFDVYWNVIVNNTDRRVSSPVQNELLEIRKYRISCSFLWIFEKREAEPWDRETLPHPPPRFLKNLIVPFLINQKFPFCLLNKLFVRFL